VRRIVVAGLIVFAVVAGVARAALLRGTPRADALAGTRAADTVDSFAGNDRIVTAWDDRRDTIDCGTGNDVLDADLPDVFVNCEMVARRLSRDRTTSFEAQHETQVEPDSLSAGSTIVSAFQSGRLEDGGAAAIAWATSTDAGKRWRVGSLAPARYSVVSDPVVARDAVHKTWLIAGVGRADAGVELWVSRSRDGLSWSAPVVAAGDEPENYDKEWLTCDNGARSPFRGRCYLAYVDFATELLGVRRSVDGGLTWSSPIVLSPGPGSLAFTGPFPVVRPNGTLVIPYALFPQSGDELLDAVVSQDGGVTFAPPLTIAPLGFQGDADVRAEGMPSADVDASGRIYVVWSDGDLREDGVSNDIVLSTSPNGVAWSQPGRIRLPQSAAGVAVSYILPAIAVAPGTSGRTAKLAVAFYSIRLENGCAVFLPRCEKQVDAWLVLSNDGGATWSAPRLLSAQPMRLAWLAATTRGRMIGDYVSVSWAGGKPWAFVPLAVRSQVGYLQAVFAATAQ
jgi:hypothetical protein